MEESTSPENVNKGGVAFSSVLKVEHCSFPRNCTRPFNISAFWSFVLLSTVKNR